VGVVTRALALLMGGYVLALGSISAYLTAAIT
jgi:hypothetical protein